MINKTRFLGILVFWWAMAGTVLVCVRVRADIYRIVDSEGVVHFTNVPTTPGYHIYMREAPVTREIPVIYERYIEAAARKHGISSALIKAVIKAESDFNPLAVSKSGACGLMQLMPETAKDLGVVDPFDVRQNIFGGTRYLKKLLVQFKGSLPLALAAYNAGPTKVQANNSIPQIPETKKFVSRVMRYIDQY
jgi:soluble lytic murein transglycosylase